MTKPLMLVVALSASVLSAAEPAGHYVLEGVMEVGSELLLKPDGKFEYMLAYGAADYSASGTWRLDGDAVVLNSAGVAGPPFRLVRSAATKAGEVRVSVQAPNGRGVEHIEVVLQTSGGELRGKTDSKGLAVFPDAREARSAILQVRVYQLEAGPYELNAANNDFTFEIDGDAITRVQFKNERLPIDGKFLELRYWNKDRAMRYRRN